MIFVPMAISLSFGVLFATAITLFLVPCIYLMLDDALQAQKQWRGGARKRFKTALGLSKS
jgi:cellobiose-specific phosphotransferase system component IIC